MRNCRSIHRLLLNHMDKNGYFHMGKYTSNLEILNKMGEHCKAHIHIAFKSTKIKDSMNRTIKRFLNEADQDYIGNQSYSFKPVHVLDEAKFWRYPLKQGLVLNLCRGFTPDELQRMHEIAAESYGVTCQVHQAKQDKRDKDDTLFLRVITKIKKNNDTTKRAIARTFIQHYLDEGRSINMQCINGYVINAQLTLKFITIDDVLDEYKFH